MYKPNEIQRLNNFILWCKGWYKPIQKDLSLFEQVRRILTLDEYMWATKQSNILYIVSNFIDEYNKYILSVGGQPYLQHKLIDDVFKYINFYDFDMNTAILISYRDFIAFDISNKHIILNPPNYNRKLYKLGFVADYKNGQSYTESNRYAKKFFNDKKK